MSAAHTELPAVYAQADQALAAAASRVRLLGAVTPRGAEAERARLVAAFEAGGEARPRWEYAPVDNAELAAQLDALGVGLETRWRDEGHPLAGVYAARAAELALEAQIAAAAGGPELGALATRRFTPLGDAAERAATLAHAWLAAPAPPASGPARTTDGPEPESLASRMRAALGEAHAPFTVEVRADLTSLAATGERTVYVAAGRAASDEDVRRTVLHEVEAHVMPRVRAARLSPGIFRVGTARGADDQEGLALCLEERAGLLRPRRAHQLAVRHAAVLAMASGASFVECVRALQREHGVAAREAVLVAERAYRGGDGERPGLGRERVYLAAYGRVRAHLAARPADLAVLASGQVALEAVAVLRPLLTALR